MRKRHFVIARNSLCEVVAAIDLAGALGAVEPKRAAEIAALAVALLR